MLDKILIIASVLTVSIAAVFMYANVTEAGQAVEDGLVGYWTFNAADIEGDTVKDVFGENDGILVGNPEIVEGKVREGLEFDGAGSYVEVPDDESLQLWETYTLEAWIYQKQIQSSRFIDRCTAGASDGPHFDNHPGTKLRSCSGGCVTSDDDITLEEWYHVVNTFDEGDVKFYINGSLAGEGTVTSPLTGNSLSFKMAADSNGENLFVGIMDEVRIYNRALSEGEVVQNMNAEGLAVGNSANSLVLTWGRIKASE